MFRKNFLLRTTEVEHRLWVQWSLKFMNFKLWNSFKTDFLNLWKKWPKSRLLDFIWKFCIIWGRSQIKKLATGTCKEHLSGLRDLKVKKTTNSVDFSVWSFPSNQVIAYDLHGSICWSYWTLPSGLIVIWRHLMPPNLTLSPVISRRRLMIWIHGSAKVTITNFVAC